MSATLIILILASLPVIFYVILIVVLLNGWKKLPQPNSNTGTILPGVSLIIACRNEEQGLPELMSSFEKIDYPGDALQIIFIDDASEDGTGQLIRDWINMRGKGFVTELIVLAETGGKKKALETGIKRAEKEWILCTDGDCSVGDQWVRTMSLYSSLPKVRMVLGPVAFKPQKGWLFLFQDMELMGLVAAGAGASGYRRSFLGNGANLMFHKDSFSECGGYQSFSHLASGDDVFLIHEFKSRFGGESITFAAHPDANVSVAPSTSCKDLFWQRIRWASKTRYYKDPFSLVVSYLMFFAQLSLAIMLLTSLVEISWIPVLGGAVFLKGAFDYCLLGKMKSLTLHKISGIHFWIMQLLYPFYVLIVGSLSWMIGYSWKGERRS